MQLPCAAAAVAVALAGCAAGEEDGPNERRFDGAKKRVAALVDEWQHASRQGDVARICERIFSDRLADRTCAGSSRERLADRHATFRVETIELLGFTRATASIVDRRGRRVLLQFFREPHAGWEITAIVR